MTNYEIMFIVKTTMEADKIKSTIEAMKKIITDGSGKVVDTKDMGERKLAYPIKKEISGKTNIKSLKKEGKYWFFFFVFQF